MRKLITLTAAVVLWGSATFASGYADQIEQAYTAAGYTQVHATKTQAHWLVTAVMNGQAVQFVVDPATGRSTRVSDDGPNHDLNDDHGKDRAGHDMNDDHGASHEAGDDHGRDDHERHGGKHG